MPSRLPRDRQPATIPTPRWLKDPCAAIAQKKRGKDPATNTMRRLVKRLEKAKIPYAVLGGMSVYAHGYRRFTDDVDVLVTPAGLDIFKERFVPAAYELAAGRTKRFLDRKNGVSIDFVISGLHPGFRTDGPIAFPDPAEVRERRDDAFFINLTGLIQLKLAARRPKDFADVVDLIRANDLDEAFLERLHPTLHHDYLEALAHRRREDEYDAKNG